MIGFQLSRASYENLKAHAVAQGPELCCGFVVSDRGTERVVRISNAATALHTRDPKNFPHDGKQGWVMDERELLEVHRAVDSGQFEMRAIYYSHIGAPAVMSQFTRARAVMWNEPIYPEVTYIILSVYGKAVPEVAGFLWDESAQDFLPTPILTPQGIHRIEVVPASSAILEMLRADLGALSRLSKNDFETFVCDRLEAMKFTVQRVGSVNEPDGGVDIVAAPKDVPFPYLLAVQAKHPDRATTKIGPGPVKDLQSVVSHGPFQAGLLVASTTYSLDARWFAEHQAHMVRLRGLSDLKRWVWDDFVSEHEWRELPSELTLRPGKVIRVPGHPRWR